MKSSLFKSWTLTKTLNLLETMLLKQLDLPGLNGLIDVRFSFGDGASLQQHLEMDSSHV